MARVTLTGPALEGLVVEDPAASIRLLLPLPGAEELVLPAWTGNEFLLADGRRPTLRTFTPRRVDTSALEVDVDVVVHGAGAASAWAAAVEPGAPAALSGPGRGHRVDAGAGSYLLLGDETAIAAISQLLETLGADSAVRVHLESDGDPLPLPPHPRAEVTWHHRAGGAPFGAALVGAAAAAAPAGHVWAAGEAAAMQQLRRLLFDERGLPRARATVRGYWKAGRSADDGAGSDPEP